MIEKNVLEIVNKLNQETTWEELANVINFATKLQGKALEVAINKGLAKGLIEAEIIKKLIDAGCTLTKRRMYQLIEFHSFKVELSEVLHLKIPETESQFASLIGGSAIEKAELFTDMHDKDNTPPEHREMRKVASVVAKAKEEAKKEMSKEKTLDTTLPEYLSPEEMVAFDDWYLKYEGIARKDNRPKVNFQEVAKSRDGLIETFASKSNDWAYARKELFSFTHPDKGGEAKVFQFIETLDKLMKELNKLKEYGQYMVDLQTLKEAWWVEYSTPTDY